MALLRSELGRRTGTWTCTATPALIALCTVAVTAATAEAATVRQCLAPFASDISQAGNEVLGKRKALISWTLKAIKLGPQFANWRIAEKRVLGCKPGKTRADGVVCIAYAAPCRLTAQNGPAPPQPPRSRKRRIGGNAPFDI